MRCGWIAILGLVAVITTACTSSTHGAALSPTPSASNAPTSINPTPTPTSRALPPVRVTSSAVAALSAKQVLALAERVAKEFGTYDYRTIKADFARIEPELTPVFKTDFIQLTSSLEPLIVKDHGITTATVTQGRLKSFTADTAVAVMSLLQRVQSSTSSARLDRSSVTITLQRQSDGQWLVSKLELT